MEKTLGILMLDCKFPRIVGDVGNPASYPFPINMHVVKGANPQRMVLEGDPTLLEPFLEAATLLESQGVSAITTSCGFLAKFQSQLAARVNVPVFASSLLQVSTVAATLREGQCVGILCADSRGMTDIHYKGARIEHIDKVVYGLQGTHFHDIYVGDNVNLDPAQAEADVVAVAKQMMEDHPNVGAIVFECTTMPPYAKAVEEATGLRVYDITTLAKYMMDSIGREKKF